jgi:hypothetical protein
MGSPSLNKVCVKDAPGSVSNRNSNPWSSAARSPVYQLVLAIWQYHSIVRRRRDLNAATIQEVVAFHSSVLELLPYAADLPFAMMADPLKRLYAKFGVESNVRALLDPRAWLPGFRGSPKFLQDSSRQTADCTPQSKGGSFGLPADFLIASDGRVLACNYGAHAFDQ